MSPFVVFNQVNCKVCTELPLDGSVHLFNQRKGLSLEGVHSTVEPRQGTLLIAAWFWI